MLCGHARAFNNPSKEHAGNSHSFSKRECRLKSSEKELRFSRRTVPSPIPNCSAILAHEPDLGDLRLETIAGDRICAGSIPTKWNGCSHNKGSSLFVNNVAKWESFASKLMKEPGEKGERWAVVGLLLWSAVILLIFYLVGHFVFRQW